MKTLDEETCIYLLRQNFGEISDFFEERGVVGLSFLLSSLKKMSIDELLTCDCECLRIGAQEFQEAQRGHV